MARVPYNGFSVSDRAVSSHFFRYLLKQGRWPAPQKERCDACFQTKAAGAQIEWHREDYSIIDPSGLVTICYRCHRVLHMREKHPKAWDDYREAIRRGWRWKPTRSFASVMAQNINGRALQGAATRVNDVRERTVLDDIHDGLLLVDPPEVREARMQELRLEWLQVKRDRGGSTSAEAEEEAAKLF